MVWQVAELNNAAKYSSNTHLVAPARHTGVTDFSVGASGLVTAEHVTVYPSELVSNHFRLESTR